MSKQPKIKVGDSYKNGRGDKCEIISTAACDEEYPVLVIGRGRGGDRCYSVTLDGAYTTADPTNFDLIIPKLKRKKIVRWGWADFGEDCIGKMHNDPEPGRPPFLGGSWQWVRFVGKEPK